MADKTRVGILISGRGSNMVSLLEGMREGDIHGEPALVFSNVPDAPGLAKAAEFGVPTESLSHKGFKPRGKHEERVIEILHRHGVELVCLAGYMRLLSPLLVGEFRNRIFNIHPALLPAFPGLHVQQQALDYGVKISGCTVHVVDEECDHGPIILQAAVPVLDDDTADTLSARILKEEHRIYREAVALYCAGRLKIEGRRVRITEPAAH
jgi:phosphoribosylglycinamide formyltransferase-1